MTTTIATRIHEITQQLACYAHVPCLMAVSKTKPVTDIAAAYHAGLRHFGENYVQEASAKIPACAQHGFDITWHYIGRIQSNKCHAIAQQFHWVHTLHRSEIATKLNNHAVAYNKQLNVCIQVNISQDENKGGIAPELAALCDLAAHIVDAPALRLRGMMAIPQSEDKDAFARAAHLFAAFQSTLQGQACDTLSMGMTHDYQTALDHGATIIRIGSGIFGART